MKPRANKAAAKKQADKKLIPGKGELSVAILDQKQEHALRLAALRLAHRMATDESLGGGNRESETKVRAILSDFQQQQQQGGGGGYDQGLICRILVHVVYFLADIGLWGLVRIISGWAIEHNCWGGV